MVCLGVVKHSFQDSTQNVAFFYIGLLTKLLLLINFKPFAYDRCLLYMLCYRWSVVPRAAGSFTAFYVVVRATTDDGTATTVTIYLLFSY